MRLKARPGLLCDRGGATMVIGVFIAAMLVGTIYYVWGIGDAVMHRERMQDASDTAAFSAAVIHARGMNMLALLNTVMAGLAVVAAALSLIAAMISYATAAASLTCLGCSIYCSYCCDACGDAATHAEEWQSAQSDADDMEDRVESLLEGLHGYAEGVRYGVPIAAQAKVVAYGADVYAPTTDFGAMAPLRAQLPAQDDETEWPCDHQVRSSARLFAAGGVLAYGSPTEFLATGVAIGALDADRHADRWCEDGYFQRVIDDAKEMGNDEYQVQAYMIGSPNLVWTQRGVAIAAWGEGEDAGSTYTRLAEAGRIGFAQAEFFYDDDEDASEEWLWHLRWRARLRRWRSSVIGASGLAEICGAECGALSSFGELDTIVVH